jgi:histidyl-tRNA synthetase
MLAVLVGERERSEGAVTVKRLATRQQETFPRAELAERLGAARER